MQSQNLLHTAKRYSSLLTNRISVLPLAILMPHSACNCRCVMCDIWKGNKNSKQLTENDIRTLLVSLKQLDTKRILMSGGEALLNPSFFSFCELIKKNGIKITLLSTGMTVARHAEKIHALVDEVIVSLDGDEETHNRIRNIKNAFGELRNGVQALKTIDPNYPVSARCVIHQLNFQVWDKIVRTAKETGLDSISFLPADVTTEAFNRPEAWEKERQDSVLVLKNDLPALHEMTGKLIREFKPEFENRFIVESPEKLMKIYHYYAAHHGMGDFPHKKCNAPWVSVVVEADGTVRPCFFHDRIGSIHETDLAGIINSPETIRYRKELDVQKNPTCVKCVCYLNLQPRNHYY